MVTFLPSLALRVLRSDSENLKAKDLDNILINMIFLEGADYQVTEIYQKQTHGVCTQLHVYAKISNKNILGRSSSKFRPLAF
jgi:hypothetical protein